MNTSDESDSVKVEAPVGRRGKKRSVFRTILLLITLTSCVSAAWVYWLWQAEPVYWQERQEFVASHTSEELLEIAESVEKRLLDALSRASDRHAQAGWQDSGLDEPTAVGVEPVIDAGSEETGATTQPSGHQSTRNHVVTAGQPAVQAVDQSRPVSQTVSMSVNELNAWMNQRLDGWLINQGKELPPGVQQPMLAIENDLMVLAFRYSSEQFSQVVSLKFRVELEAVGEAVVRLEQIDGGRLPLPAKTVTRQMRNRMQNEADKQANGIQQMAEAFDGMTFNPVMDLNQQNVRFVALTLHPDGVDLVVTGDGTVQ